MSRFNRLAVVVLIFSPAALSAQDIPLDAQGDTLPPFAVARLGTARWRSAIRDGHGSAALSYSRDGKWLACTSDRAVEFFEVATGRQVRWFPRSMNLVAACFLNDGKTLLTAEDSTTQAAAFGQPFTTTVRRHDLVAQKTTTLGTFSRTGHMRGLCEFLSDGRFLRGSTYDQVGIWDPATGAPVFVLDQKDLDAFSTHLAASDDGKLVAYGGRDRSIRVVELETKKVLHTIPYDVDGPDFQRYWRIHFAPDGKTLVADTAKTTRFWDLTTGKLTREIDGRTTGIWTPDGAHTVVSGANLDSLSLVDAKTLKVVRDFGPLPHYAIRTAISPDGKRLAAALGYTIAFWDIETGQRLQRGPGHESTLAALAFSPDGAGLASGAEDGDALLWQLTDGRADGKLDSKIVHCWPGHAPAAYSFAFRPDGKTLAVGEGLENAGSGSHECDIAVYDLDTGKQRARFPAHLNSVSGLLYSPDRKTLVSSGTDNRVRAWNAETGERLWQARRLFTRSTPAWTADGKALLVATGGDVRMLDIQGGKTVKTVVNAAPGEAEQFRPAQLENIQSVHLLPEGMAASFGSQQLGFDRVGTLRFWEQGSGRETRSMKLAGIAGAWGAFALSPDGTVAAANLHKHDRARGFVNPSDVCLWDTETGAELMRLPGHTNAVMSLAFSPDGRRLASASRDTTVLVWDVSRIRLWSLWSKLAKDAKGQEAEAALAANPPGTVAFLSECVRRAAALDAAPSRAIAKLGDDAARGKATQDLLASPGAELALRHAAQSHPAPAIRDQAKAVLAKFVAGRPAAIARALQAMKDGDATAAAALKLHGIAAADGMRPMLGEPLGNTAARDAAVRPRWEETLAVIDAQPPLTPDNVGRAIALLRHIDSKNARQCLEDVSRGPAESFVAEQARAALAK